ncbi:beta-lactamase family protein [Saccharibacillus sp. CPCC 101409]|uniref:beta-lactamase family protein n=1 Tax=Saccharibacillus sp. CPCC 101409 TaxID=3058041 RepID=UPI0026730100|nr:beta-lactamase family protein [Saccharibacillus sp. CPCC 101409]MDO3413106.1 beta-lactamase family protein [Saccharibacillus sp. CPCC 101409]
MKNRKIWKVASTKWAKALLASTLALTLVPSTFASAAPAAQSAAAKQTDTALTASSVNAFLDEFFALDEVKEMAPGAAVVVVKNGKTLAEKGYGYAKVDGKKKVDPQNTVFRMASVSKTFVAAAAMQLVEQGKLGLDDDIRTYLGDITFDNPFAEPVTVADLLTHRSGFQIQDILQEDVHDDFDERVSIEDYVRKYMPDVVREPGTAYMYDNFAYLLLGYIVERASGTPFETYMQKNVFSPLGMKSSSFMLSDDLVKRSAEGYSGGEPLGIYTLRPTVMPEGGMLSTAGDIAKFMTAFLNDGKTASGASFLKPDSVASMETYRSSIHPLLPDTTYGFEAPSQLPGAGSSDKVITKAGDMPGASSLMFLIPEQDTGVFVVYNENGGLREMLYAAFIYRFFPQYAKEINFPAYAAESPEQLNRYAGLYKDLRVESVVSKLGTSNRGRMVMSDPLTGERALRQVADGLFIDADKMLVAFKTESDGSVSYLKEPYLNPAGYEQKGLEPAGFNDIPSTHPYSKYILDLQSLRYYPNDPNLSFGPDQPVTRGEYVDMLMRTSAIPLSENAPEFSDVKGHPYAAAIQTAYEYGLISGSAKGQFNPDRPITRQEAAAIIYNSTAGLYPEELLSSVKLTGKTDKWAVPAVKLMVLLGYYGPEVKINAAGAADYQSKKVLTRAENAAINDLLLTSTVLGSQSLQKPEGPAA